MSFRTKEINGSSFNFTLEQKRREEKKSKLQSTAEKRCTSRSYTTRKFEKSLEEEKHKNIWNCCVVVVMDETANEVYINPYRWSAWKARLVRADLTWESLLLLLLLLLNSTSQCDTRTLVVETKEEKKVKEENGEPTTAAGAAFIFLLFFFLVESLHVKPPRKKTRRCNGRRSKLIYGPI